VKWYRGGSELGNEGAQGALGHGYMLGRGVLADCEQAAKWLGLAAAKKGRISLLNFGMLYDKGCGVPHDEREALRLFLESANLGLGQAQFNLGVYYRDGKGTEVDPVASYFWFSIAAREQFPQAQDRADKMRKLLTPARIAEVEQRLKEWKPAPE